MMDYPSVQCVSPSSVGGIGSSISTWEKGVREWTDIFKNRHCPS